LEINKFTTWLTNHSNYETLINYIINFFINESNEPSIDLATLVNDITYKNVCHLEINGTQINWHLNSLMEEEDILFNPLHFKKTSYVVEVGSNLPIYPLIPNDWYHHPLDLVHVHEFDWKNIHVGFLGE
jgi:hypothetical protein